MAGLYSNFSPVSHTLQEFTARASRLYHNEDHDGFIRFVLTGEYVDGGSYAKQAFLDPIQNVVRQDHGLTVARDYDSAIGIADRILVDGPINAYAVPHPTYGLSSSIHIRHSIRYRNVSL